ncbi:polysaccharide lyase family 7 protein [Pendulispora brunnea]|uniref:Polysaccharide lyase family 7 protein n=1 Tax=Pendulispora brunnea TaxID=2905690 RepID=A0ABZ2KE85_9BACT
MKSLSTLTAMGVLSCLGGAACASPAKDAETEQPGESTATLERHVAPGGNFDLSVWELQEPVGPPGHPTTIASARLRGPNGFQDRYFYTDSNDDGSMTFWTPENGSTTANSDHARSELREMNANGSPANWNPFSGNHTLSATVKVSKVPYKVCVGQIHLGTGTPPSSKPLLELYYYSSGEITVGIQRSPTDGQYTDNLGHADVGSPWNYEIGLSGRTISITVDGRSKHYTMASSFDHEGMYFKAGNYIQSSGGSSSVGSLVHFYKLRISHH